jgi:superfamily II RNA helicase
LKTKRGPYRRRRTEEKGLDTIRPKADRGLLPLLKEIGAPEERPFVPDPFQLEALGYLSHHDCIVSAPTGSGKTWIAARAVEDYLKRGLRCWYASPLKALSNSIYAQFKEEFGDEACGILTGDRKENPSAPVIVGTTEILRNQLYDAMHQGLDLSADMVILDEAHYLSDPERGVVWEEVLIYLPARVRLLLLSATISNPQDLLGWLGAIRGHAPKLVLSRDRPVPLKMLFLFPDGEVTLLGGKRGIKPRIKRLMEGGGTALSLRYADILSCLRRLNLLPAIFFLKSRADCDRAVRLCPPLDESSPVKRNIRTRLVEILKHHPHLKGHRQLRYLMEAGVGAHHAGHLPYWKALIEKMMQEGLLEAIFSTSTVAAGVNFPARTVVLFQSDRFNGKDFVPLTSTELHQMIGRAGRRGKDRIGFALLVPGRHQDPQLLHELEGSPAEPLVSRIHINFSMTLNLLLSHRPGEVKDLLERSFAAYRMERSGVEDGPTVSSLLTRLREEVPQALCDASDPYEMIELIGGRLSSSQGAQKRSLLTPGRIFRHRNGKLYVVCRLETRRGKTVCAAYRIDPMGRRRGRPVPKRIDLARIKEITDRFMEPDKAAGLNDRVGEPLEIDSQQAPPRKGGADICNDCPHLRICRSRKNSVVHRLLGELSKALRKEGGSSLSLWLSFKKHLRFLKYTGFADEDDRLTSDGLWASRLRLDQPLLIAEAIRKKAFDGLSPTLLASALAPFVWDRSVEVSVRGKAEPTSAYSVWSRLMDSIAEITRLKAAWGFETPPLQFWPSVALYLWAGQRSWEEVLKTISADEGDLASLIMRTADHLRQITNLKETHPALAQTASEAIRLIMREPVYFD